MNSSKMITAKDCMYLSDLTSLIANFSKKCQYYKTITTNEDVKSTLDEVWDSLKNQCTHMYQMIGGKK